VAWLQRAATRLCLVVAAFISAAGDAQTGASGDMRPALFDVTLNGQRGDEPVMVLRDADGAIYASAEAFARWRLRLPPALPVRHEGRLYYPLAALPAARVRVDEAAQAVAIDLAAAAFETQRARLDAYEDVAMTPPATGAFLNYDLLFEHVGGDSRIGGAFQLGLFTRHGVGETGFVASSAPGAPRLVRLETAWTIDRPADATTIRIGDSVSSAGPGAAPVRFAGVHYYRNYAVRPGFITMPLPDFAGGAAVPSVVDIYVNNILQGSREVAPGPFELSNVPVASGGGTVQLVVRDLLGRKIVSEQSYYASTQLLRRGLHDFSWEAGFVRRDFGRRSHSYGELMAATTHRYGLSDRITGEAHLQASESTQMAAIGLTALAFDLGQVGGSVSVSRSDRGTGFRLAGAFERRAGGLSFGALAEFHSRDFAFIGMPDGFRPPRLVLQGFADLSLRRGSVGLNLLHRERADGRRETLAGLVASYRLAANVSARLFARHSVAGERQTVVGAHLAVALGGRRSAAAGFEHDRRGAFAYAAFQQNPPAGVGGGFRAAASYGRVDRVEAAYVHNLPMATLAADAAHSGGRTGLRLTATGSVGILGGRVFAARSLGDSFATVRVDGRPGLKVYADDQLVGVTGRDGALVVPGLRAWEPNRIRIDETDLPLDAQIEATELIVRPFARTGTIVRFAVARERGVLMRVRLEDGSDLPAGATVRVEGAPGEHVVASDGAVYVPDLPASARLRAVWSGGSCRFAAIVPASDDPQPRLDGLVCREEPAYAAN